MGVERKEKGNEKVVRIPECLKRLLTDAMVSGGIHHHHAEEHDMTRNTPGLGKMDLNRAVVANIVLFDIEETIQELEYKDNTRAGPT